jgi:hypothetical protein
MKWKFPLINPTADAIPEPDGYLALFKKGGKAQ